MAVKQPNPMVRIVATVFTSVVAPTLVALITTTIRDSPRPVGTQTVCSYGGGSASAPASVPTVTLLPPAPVPAQAPLVWRPVTTTEASVTSARAVPPRY